MAAAPPGSPFKPGDRVFGSAQGSLAERVLAKPELVLPLPDALSFDQGAGAFFFFFFFPPYNPSFWGGGKGEEKIVEYIAWTAQGFM